MMNYYITITGDMDDNGVVNLFDLGLFADYWPDEQIVGWPDFNNDKKITLRDFALLASNWRLP